MNDAMLWTIIAGFLGMQVLTLLVVRLEVRALRSDIGGRISAVDERLSGRLDTIDVRVSSGLDEVRRRLDRLEGRGPLVRP